VQEDASHDGGFGRSGLREVSSAGLISVDFGHEASAGAVDDAGAIRMRPGRLCDSATGGGHGGR